MSCMFFIFQRISKYSNKMTETSQFQFDNIPPLHRKLLSTSKRTVEYFTEQGYVVRTGPFSREEDDIIRKNMEKFLEENPDMNSDWLLGYGIKARRDRDRRNALGESYFLARLAHGLPDRLLDSVRRRARKICHKNAPKDEMRRRRFSADEASRLMKLREVLGNDFVKMSELVQRTPASIECRVNYMLKRDNVGFLNENDAQALAKIVYGQLNANQSAWNRDISWPDVKKSIKRIKNASHEFEWQNYMKKHLANVLVPFLEKIAESHPLEATDIDWEVLAHEFDLPNAISTRELFESAMSLMDNGINDCEDDSFRKKIRKLRRFYRDSADSVERLCNKMLESSDSSITRDGA